MNYTRYQTTSQLHKIASLLINYLSLNSRDVTVYNDSDVTLIDPKLGIEYNIHHINEGMLRITAKCKEHQYTQDFTDLDYIKPNLDEFVCKCDADRLESVQFQSLIDRFNLYVPTFGEYDHHTGRFMIDLDNKTILSYNPATHALSSNSFAVYVRPTMAFDIVETICTRQLNNPAHIRRFIHNYKKERGYEKCLTYLKSLL